MTATSMSRTQIELDLIVRYPGEGPGPAAIRMILDMSTRPKHCPELAAWPPPPPYKAAAARDLS
jgi:hypothetical protein